MSESPMIQRIRGIVEPIACDLGLDLYDLEQRGATLRVTLDTRPGAAGGVDLDQLSLATRLISRELDHQDPVPGRYTLEVTSPGVERSLRTPAHYGREIGKKLSVRLADTNAELRRLEGVLIAADETSATIRVATAAGDVDHVVALSSIDRARTVFEWGPQPKPGKTANTVNTAKERATRSAKAGRGRTESAAATGQHPIESDQQPEPLGAAKETS